MSVIELASFVGALAGAWLAARARAANWPVGIASAACFLVLFIDARLYANAGLQLVFIALGGWGWLRWRQPPGDGDAAGFRVRAGRTARWRLAAGALTGFGATLALLSLTPDSASPVADAAVAAGSLAATWAQARRWIDCWPVWLGVDLIAAPLYASQQLWLTALLYLVLAALCVLGWRNWSRLPVRTAWNGQGGIGTMIR